MNQNIYDNNEFFRQYEAIRVRENNYNNLLEQPNFLTLIPNLEEKVVLDIGCGMGDFAAYCIGQGANYVTGIDISLNMISEAKKRHSHEHLTFTNIAFEDMNIQNDSIDFISSSLVFHYIEDFQLLIKKISTALSDEGTLLFSIEHPIVTANKGSVDWVSNREGNLLHFAIDRYQEEGLRSQNWLVDNVMMYHRTLSTIINTLIEVGLQIEKIIEPIPTIEAVKNLPGLNKEFRRPSFLIVKARKI
ncbi:SAM-dependent methyltransferase [Solibacillus sp. R5-41]|uniref:class I SAM-dependent methyltransferase n=1 Tax=Solibacillus sp. R5-41 TaxID=2048654 RepID=UPI000C1274DF|nr:class I SAM-dependent methyltransferase [Solibacillus sp. R5-41]ATP39860.1 SAM-dependent methyltransferase [Solibacillus sp. R5-41]